MENKLHDLFDKYKEKQIHYVQYTVYVCIFITIYTFKSKVSRGGRGIPVKDGFVLVIVIDSIYRLVGAPLCERLFVKAQKHTFSCKLVLYTVDKTFRLS